MIDNEIFEYQVLIRENHLDCFGHVNNSVYVQLYEEARWDFITKKGRGLDYVQEHQIGPIILDLKVRFKREIKNREQIKIISKVVELGKRVIVLEQTMLKSDGQVASEATFMVGVFDLKERRLVDIGPDWIKALGIKEG